MKNPSRLCAIDEKIMYTINICCNAAGKYLPPYVVYKAEGIYDVWTKDGPPNCEYTCSPSGWMETQQFLDWFRLFIKWTDDKGGCFL
jgi:hypothetical protein